ncbi:hypothetical protein FRB98_001347, partial [Tulasnella sp. 332]
KEDVDSHPDRIPECKALADHASDVLYAIEAVYNTTNEAQLEPGLRMLDETLTAMRTDVELWKDNSLLKSLSSKYLGMPNRLELHRSNLDKALANVESRRGIASSAQNRQRYSPALQNILPVYQSLALDAALLVEVDGAMYGVANSMTKRQVLLNM